MAKRDKEPTPEAVAAEIGEMYSHIVAEVGGDDDSPTPDGMIVAAASAVAVMNAARAPAVVEEKSRTRPRYQRGSRDDDEDDDEPEERPASKRAKKRVKKQGRNAGRQAKRGGRDDAKPRDVSAFCGCGCDCWQDYDEDFDGCECDMDEDECVNEYRGKLVPCGCLKPKPLVGGVVTMQEDHNGNWRWIEDTN